MRKVPRLSSEYARRTHGPFFAAGLVREEPKLDSKEFENLVLKS
jgi:hypothetical protein